MSDVEVFRATTGDCDGPDQWAAFRSSTEVSGYGNTPDDALADLLLNEREQLDRLVELGSARVSSRL